MRTLLSAVLCLLLAGTIYADSKPVYLYFAAVANFQELSDPERIRYNLDRAVEIGVTDVIVGVKHVSGEVLYQSDHAPQITNWWGFERPADYDFLNIFIQKAHQRGLKVHAAMNVFAEGHVRLERGRVYDDKPHWQVRNYTPEGIVPVTSQTSRYTATVNPADIEVQNHQIELLKELVVNFDLDGIVLDRVKYSGIESDFSELSLAQFEEYIGQAVPQFPQSIFRWSNPDGNPIGKVREGLFKLWLEWRAKVMHDFTVRARQAVKNINPNVALSIFTGSWYPTYYREGLNWGSKNYDPSKQYDWASPGYKEYGIAELLDFALMNCYFYEVTAEDIERFNTYSQNNPELGLPQHKEWYSVEGAIAMSKHAIQGATPVIASLHIHQYRDNPSQLERAIESALQNADGLMLFDVIHLREYNFWEIVKNSIK